MQIKKVSRKGAGGAKERREESIQDKECFNYFATYLLCATSAFAGDVPSFLLSFISP